jgi:hypothetical protein
MPDREASRRDVRWAATSGPESGGDCNANATSAGLCRHVAGRLAHGLHDIPANSPFTGSRPDSADRHPSTPTCCRRRPCCSTPVRASRALAPASSPRRPTSSRVLRWAAGARRSMAAAWDPVAAWAAVIGACGVVWEAAWRPHVADRLRRPRRHADALGHLRQRWVRLRSARDPRPLRLPAGRDLPPQGHRHSRAARGVELYPSLEVAPVTPRTAAYPGP